MEPVWCATAIHGTGDFAWASNSAGRLKACWLDVILILTPCHEPAYAPFSLYRRGSPRYADHRNRRIYTNRRVPAVRRVLYDADHDDDGGIRRDPSSLARGPGI